MNLAGELDQLARRFVVARKQDHHTDQRMNQPLPVGLVEPHAFDANDHRSEHQPSSVSAIAYAIAKPRSSLSETCSRRRRPWMNSRRPGVATVTTGRPEGSLPISTARQLIGCRIPSPSALEIASLAAKRVARKSSPGPSERAPPR